MSDLPLVSICIATWNRARLVCHAVQTVLGQDYPGPIEIVVADDGSTDDTLVSLAQFGDRVVVLPGEHRGIAAAKNRALLGATGDIRGILDSDDFYHPKFVSRCVETLLEHPEGLVYTDNYYVDETGQRTLAPALDWSLTEFLETCNLRGDSWLAWWKIIERTNLHDERFALEVDYDLFYQLAQLTEFRRIRSPLQSVRSHTGRVTKDRVTAAYWHAAGLGKYGHSIEYALVRARRAGAEAAWGPAIERGYQFGRSIRAVAMSIG